VRISDLDMTLTLTLTLTLRFSFCATIAHSLIARVLFAVVKQRSSVKLTFGDADSQQNSPMSKRLRLATDSVDCLADLRDQPLKSSVVSGSEDTTPRKFRLLFGGSSEDLSQQVLPGDGDHRDDDVEAAESDVTCSSRSRSSADTSQSEYEEGKDEDVMTQADEEAMKTYVPLNAGALSYISDDDDDDNVLDFFLKPLNDRTGTANRKTAKSFHLYSSIDDAAAAAACDDGVIYERAKSSIALSRTSSVIDSLCNNTGKEVVASKLLVQESGTSIHELNGNDGDITDVIPARVADKFTVASQCGIGSANKESCLASKVAMSAVDVVKVRTVVAEGMEDTRQSCSQRSDDFRAPASQNSTHHSIVVVDADVTSRSAGSQPFDSDSTVDIGCSPVKNRLHPAAAAGNFASDASTTDGWCTPCKPSAPDVIVLTDVQSCGTNKLRTFDDESAVSPRRPCPKLTIVSSSSSQPCVSDAQFTYFKSSLSTTGSSQSPCLKFTDDFPSSTGFHPLSSSAANVQVVRPHPDVLSLSSSASSDAATKRQVVADSYDGDVDSDSDDVISLCVGVRRRRRPPRSRSTSASTVVISSDSDRSPTVLRRSRDFRSKDGVARVDITTLSSGSESDDSVPAGRDETDCRQHDFPNSTSAVDRSPVLFSEPST